MSSKLLGKNTSRYASRNAVEGLVGPSLGLASDVTTVSQNLADGQIKQKDIHAVRKLMPYQNLFWIRKLLDEAETGIGESIGAQP